MASSTQYSDSLPTIENEWSIDDVLDAHDVLDMYEELDARASAPAEG